MSNRPFRSLNAKQYKNIVYRAGLKCSSSPTANVFADGLTTSTLYTAVPSSSKGAVLPLPVDFEAFTNPVNPPVIFAHPGNDITDLQFSPHAPNVLATVAKDDKLMVFELPPDGKMEGNIATANVVITELAGASSIAFHPTVRGLIAIGCRDYIAIALVDYEKFGAAGVSTSPQNGRLIIKVPTASGPGKEVVKIAWDYKGEFLNAIGKDGSFYIVDPRKVTDFETPIKSYTDLFGVMKAPHFAAFVGEQSLPGDNKVIFIAGLGAARKPTFRVLNWNPTTGEASIFASSDLGNSSGQLLGKYDYDTQLLYIMTRSSQSANIYDTTFVSGVQGSKPNLAFFTPLINIPIPSGSKGLSQCPKTACDQGESEIINFYSNQGDNVELYSINVIRKDRGYNEEIYPNTFAGEASVTLDEYMCGKTVQPIQKSLNGGGSVSVACNNNLATTPSFQQQPESNTTTSNNNTAAQQQQPKPEEPEKSGQQLLAEQAGKGYDLEVRKAISQQFQRTTFLHTTGNEPGLNKDTYLAFDVRPPKAHLAFGRNMVANNTHWALPLGTTGGSQILVRRLDCLGRVPAKPNAVHGPSPVTALAVSQLNHYQIATASDDGTVRVYNLPKDWTEGELPADIDTPAFEFPLGVRIQVMSYHTYVENCLIATGYDVNSQQEILFVFDITPGTEGEQRYQAYPGVVKDRATHIDFCQDGVHISIANKRSEIAVVSMPGGQLKFRIAHGANQPRESWGFWYSHEYLVTIGFIKGGERGVILHKMDWEKNTSIIVKTQSFYNTYLLIPYLDPLTGILIMGGLGTANYNVFFISPESAPYIDSLSLFQSRGDVVGMAYLPKANVDVHDVEIVKSIKLNQSNEVWNLSWRLPRKRKEFFQDDVYGAGAPELKTIISSSDYFNAQLENDPSGPTDRLSYKSLQPAGMTPLSEAPEEELTARQLQYIQQKKIQNNEVEVPVGFMGHTTREEVEQHYLDKMERVGVTNRWTVSALDDCPVADDEWD